MNPECGGADSAIGYCSGAHRAPPTPTKAEKEDDQ